MILNNNNGFGGLEVACRPLVPKFAGSKKNPQHAFLRRGNLPLVKDI
jgi:hypothetical protein